MNRSAEEDIHFRVLRILELDPEISQRALAAKLGIALGRTNYVLNALVEKGLIKIGNFSRAADKRRYAYVLTPAGMARKAAITRRFLARKIAEYEDLKAEIESLRGEMRGLPHPLPPNSD
ncbi:MAG: MarR family EPS-associated transcriptional regulator [Rhodobacteraceae bacterium]|jgi:EPS-associated MarR family transcriptional regulator|nr:MarR family EPS-associated transcriptional regulator [Paracoccaceae bacterium]